MSGLREVAAVEAPAWKQALLERKRAKLAAGAGPERGAGPGAEAGAVVAESLGPLRENPFMRLESERRRRRRRGGTCEPPGPARPAERPALAQLLQLYGALPGVRTIRAGNVLIIESSGPAEAALGSGAGDGPGSQDPLRDLLGPRGSPVTEVRAGQVVVYESEAPLAAGPDSGLVSRLLQKFDRAAKGKRAAGDGPAVPEPPPPGSFGRPAPWPAIEGGGVFLHKTGSNSFTVNPRGHRPGIAAASALSPGGGEGATAPSSRPCQRGAASVSQAAVPSFRSPAASSPPEAAAGKPKSEAAAKPLPQPPPSATPDSCASARPYPFSSAGGSFEIRSASEPDLGAIPAHDLQARALASLRLRSRHSLLFVPGRKKAPPEAEAAETPVPVTCIDADLVAAVPPLEARSPRLEDSLPSSPLPAGLLTRTGASSFTVVPQRKPPAARLQQQEEEDGSQKEGKMGALGQELGRTKKRYPTVNEIQVIGGYLSLNKSCMSKSSFRRKKMKISFNETSLQTMFEYPPERSLVEEEEEYATDVDEEQTFLIPHPASTVNSGFSSYSPKHSLGFDTWQEQQHEKLPSSIGALPQETNPPDRQVTNKAEVAGKVLSLQLLRGKLALQLTSAEKSHLSDFSSEPALYF